MNHTLCFSLFAPPAQAGPTPNSGDAGSVSEDHLLMLAATSEVAASLPALSADSFAERVAGPMALVQFSELHCWYYFPALTEKELLIFK